MIRAIRDLGQSILKSTKGEDREKRILESLVEDLSLPRGKNKKFLLVRLDLETDKGLLKRDIEEIGKRDSNGEARLDMEKFVKVLWVGDPRGNEDQDRPTTRHLEYLVSQTIPNLYHSLHSPEDLKKFLEPAWTWFHDDGEETRVKHNWERYRYLLDLSRVQGSKGRALLSEHEWKEILGDDPKKRPDEVARALSSALNISTDETVLYSFSINGTPIAATRGYHQYLYTTLVKKFFGKEGGTCHSCGAINVPVTSDFTRLRFKTFINDKENFASGVTKEGFGRNYALCQECYESVMVGERFIERELSTFLIGSNVLLIPEFEHNTPDADEIRRIAESIIQREVGGLARLQKVPDLMDVFRERQGYHQLTLLFYKPVQSARKVMEVIPEVPPARLESVACAFLEANDEAEKLWGPRGEDWGWLNGLDDLLSILPVRKAGQDTHARPALALARNLLIGVPVKEQAFVADCLQVSRAIFHGSQEYYAREQNIHDYLLRAMTLVLALKRLNLWRESTKNGKGLTKMEQDYKEYFGVAGFDEPRQGLFLLGVIIGRIGYEQGRFSDGKKAILHKINYQGMPLSRVRWLASELHEKLTQYRKKCFHFDEPVWAEAMKLITAHEASWALTDKQNVYYLLCGYAFETQRMSRGGRKKEITEEVEKGVTP